jgi:hypothetical protein
MLKFLPKPAFPRSRLLAETPTTPAIQGYLYAKTEAAPSAEMTPWMLSDKEM